MSDDALAVQERLSVLERTIERGMQTFVEVGAALQEIKEQRLYREQYATFEEYCKDRWSWTIRRAQQMMQAASVVGELKDANHGSPLPANERVARELARLPEPAQRQAAWQEATRDDAQPTASVVRAIVRRVEMPEPEPVRMVVKVSEPDTTHAVPTMHESPPVGLPARSTDTLGQPGNLNAAPGSREWAIAVRLRVQSGLHDTLSDANMLGHWMQLMEQHRGYAALPDERGRPFASWRAFCTAKQPWGLGHAPDAIPYLPVQSLSRPPELPKISPGERQPIRLKAEHIRRGLPKSTAPERLAVAVADNARELRLTREWAAWAKDWILRLDAALQAVEDALAQEAP